MQGVRRRLFTAPRVDLDAGLDQNLAYMDPLSSPEQQQQVRPTTTLTNALSTLHLAPLHPSSFSRSNNKSNSRGRMNTIPLRPPPPQRRRVIINNTPRVNYEALFEELSAPAPQPPSAPPALTMSSSSSSAQPMRFHMDINSSPQDDNLEIPGQRRAMIRRRPTRREEEAISSLSDSSSSDDDDDDDDETLPSQLRPSISERDRHRRRNQIPLTTAARTATQRNIFPTPNRPVLGRPVTNPSGIAAGATNLPPPPVVHSAPSILLSPIPPPRPLSEFDLELIRPIEVEEVKNEASKLSRAKAPDYYGVSNEFLIWLPDEMYVHLTEIYNHVFYVQRADEDYPLLWKKGRLVFLAKDKSDPALMSDPSNYRPITLLNSQLKLFEKVLLRRLTRWAECQGERWFHQAQAGFRPERSCPAQALPIQVLKQWGDKTGNLVYAVFLDVAKAFDSVSHEGMELKMRMMGLPDRMTATLAKLVRGHISVFGDESIEVKRGVPQGSVLGPFGFISFFDLAKEINEEVAKGGMEPMTEELPSHVYLWADDTALVARNPRDMRRLLLACDRWAHHWGLSFNPKKSYAMLLGGCGGASGRGRKVKRTRTQLAEFRIGGEVIEYTNMFKHIGVRLTTGLETVKERKEWEDNLVLKRVEEKMSTVMTMLKWQSWLPRGRALTMALSFLTPALTFDCAINELVEGAEVCMNNALRGILGAYDRTHRPFLYWFTGTWRLTATVKYRRLCTLTKWLVFSHVQDEPFDAITLAQEHDLPIWKNFEKLLVDYGLGEEFSELVMASREWIGPLMEMKRKGLTRAQTFGTERDRVWKEIDKKKEKIEKMYRRFKESAWVEIEKEEQTWRMSRFEGVEIDKSIFEPHPAMKTRRAHIAFMMAYDYLNPPDYVEPKEGEESQGQGQGQGDVPLNDNNNGNRRNRMLISRRQEDATRRGSDDVDDDVGEDDGVALEEGRGEGRGRRRRAPPRSRNQWWRECPVVDGKRRIPCPACGKGEDRMSHLVSECENVRCEAVCRNYARVRPWMDRKRFLNLAAEMSRADMEKKPPPVDVDELMKGLGELYTVRAEARRDNERTGRRWPEWAGIYEEEESSLDYV